MIKRLITYTDFNGREQTEAFFFNLTRTELTNLELSEEGSYSERIKSIIECRNDKNMKKLINIIKDLIGMAYGEKSEDGKRFVKNSRIREEFESSAAYDTYVTTLLTNENELLEFLKGIMPVMTAEQQKQLDDEVNKYMAQNAQA